MKTIKIILEGGLVEDVEGLPKGYDYFVDDNQLLICTAYACTEPQGGDGEFCEKHLLDCPHNNCDDNAICIVCGKQQ